MADAPSGGSGGGGLWNLFGLFLLVFIFWIISGGTSHPLSFTPPFASSTSQTLLGSSHNSLVSFIRDTSGVSFDTGRQYISLMAFPMGTSTISTEGWKLKSVVTGREVMLPGGVTLPGQGQVNEVLPIRLSSGDSIIIDSGRSPVGVSFKENKCTGYLGEHQNFAPPLAKNCPTPYQEFTQFYDNTGDSQCAFFVRNIPQCSTSTQIPSDVSGSCADFADRYLNYEGCVAAHHNDPDFTRQTWRVYLGASDSLWRSRGETIQLIDAKGVVLDSFSY